METLNDFVMRKFGIDEKTFLEILKISPGAEGYLLGSLGEQLFKQYAESKGFEVLRIKEKPDGGYDAKSDDARGDFYIRKKGSKKDEWLVVECKSVKSNAEKRANLTKKSSCLTMLEKYSIKRSEHIESIYNSGFNAYKKSKQNWQEKHSDRRFPTFKWSKQNPGAGIPDLSGLWKNKTEIKKWIDSFDDKDFSEDAYWNLKAPIRLIQTHMPSTRVDELGIKSTGPLVSEFNILCLDLFLRTGKHEFIFVNSQDLNHQAKSPNHLQQNYTIDVLTAKDKFKRHKLLKPWYDDLVSCINETNPTPRKLDESQLDRR
ncbi:MAG: hypothetical protein PHU62_07545 [Bacteroidales bacterium]|jgi:hypothetical protein|nr:hypothetical protein [Bacteroidales bacterium]MDD2205017.1 hypothetical protein [Bacteroidales bacterium]MDD3152411.1 hypothetical protein [Bacteroidales bacterium]MDD3914495.1 hypothetical protein [Bacteroidales bacterium]MDD4634406.1 hypothetical protein [Bacteroidales bacterium]